jgi:hypothetical protein
MGIIIFQKKKLPEMLKQFPKYVDLQEISQLSKVPMGVVERINSYWITKRLNQSMNLNLFSIDHVF